MPQFRGVDRDAILDSLKRAAAFLDEFYIEKKWLPVSWDGPYALQQIERAQSDEELVRAIRETQTCEFFQPLFRLFGYYALADKTAETIHLFHDLAQWGAFDIKERKPVPVQIAAIIVADMVKTLNSEDFQAESYTHQRLRKAFHGLQTSNVSLNSVREKMLVDFMVSAQDKPGSEAQKRFLDMRRDDQEFVLNVLQRVKAHDRLQVLLEGHSPMQYYCLLLDDIPVQNRKEYISQTLTPLKRDMTESLLPFMNSGQILSNWYGLMRKDGPGGYVFIGTRAAAQALADRLPNERVIDFRERRIMPAPPPPGPAAGPSPDLPSPS